MNPKINVPGGANAKNPVIAKTAMRFGLFIKLNKRLKEHRSSPASGAEIFRESYGMKSQPQHSKLTPALVACLPIIPACLLLALILKYGVDMPHWDNWHRAGKRRTPLPILAGGAFLPACLSGYPLGIKMMSGLSAKLRQGKARLLFINVETRSKTYAAERRINNLREAASPLSCLFSIKPRFNCVSPLHVSIRKDAPQSQTLESR
ncbi:MAG: hypothetical protein M3371_13040 [Acidobacteriota bacterium]|nr:hypothetical protein [Acidobacteriota bacterium]